MADGLIRREPMVRITKQIKNALEQALECPCITDELRKQCQSILEEEGKTGVISTRVIREIYNTLRTAGKRVFLHEIIEDTSLVPQTLQLPTRNPELEARIQKLKTEQENREYKRMTRNVEPRGKQAFTFQEEVKSMNRQMVAVLNFVITVAAGFAFGYKGTEMVVGKVFPMQMMSGLIFGTIIFFADLYFLLMYGR